MYILVIDDDRFSNTLVQFVLAKEGYETEITDDPRDALQMIQKREPDLLLLDDVMPYLNGFQLAEKLHAEGYEIPIIFMAGNDNINAKLQSFKLGAHDYISKPYDHQDLIARVQHIMRRLYKQKSGNTGNYSIRCGQFELIPAQLRVTIPGHSPVLLAPTEMQVLRVLMSASGQVVRRDQLLTEVWNEHKSSSNIVDVYIRRLRMKLEENADKPKRIISIRGIGYKFLGNV